MFAYNEFYLNHVFLSHYSFFPTICFSIRTLVVVFEGVNLRALIATAFAATALYSYITFFWGFFFVLLFWGGGGVLELGTFLLFVVEGWDRGSSLQISFQLSLGFSAGQYNLE